MTAGPGDGAVNPDENVADAPPPPPPPAPAPPPGLRGPGQELGPGGGPPATGRRQRNYSSWSQWMGRLAAAGHEDPLKVSDPAGFDG